MLSFDNEEKNKKGSTRIIELATALIVLVATVLAIVYRVDPFQDWKKPEQTVPTEEITSGESSELENDSTTPLTKRKDSDEHVQREDPEDRHKRELDAKRDSLSLVPKYD